MAGGRSRDLDALGRAGMPEHRARAYHAIDRPLAALF